MGPTKIWQCFLPASLEAAGEKEGRTRERLEFNTAISTSHEGEAVSVERLDPITARFRTTAVGAGGESGGEWQERRRPQGWMRYIPTSSVEVRRLLPLRSWSVVSQWQPEQEVCVAISAALARLERECMGCERLVPLLYMGGVDVYGCLVIAGARPDQSRVQCRSESTVARVMRTKGQIDSFGYCCQMVTLKLRRLASQEKRNGLEASVIVSRPGCTKAGGAARLARRCRKPHSTGAVKTKCTLGVRREVVGRICLAMSGGNFL